MFHFQSEPHQSPPSLCDTIIALSPRHAVRGCAISGRTVRSSSTGSPAAAPITKTCASAAYFKQALHEKRIEHKQYIEKHSDDMPAISGWKWGAMLQTRYVVQRPPLIRSVLSHGPNYAHPPSEDTLPCLPITS